MRQGHDLPTSVNNRVISPGFYFHENKILAKISELKVNTDYLNKNSKGNLITLKQYVYSVSIFRPLGRKFEIE